MQMFITLPINTSDNLRLLRQSLNCLKLLPVIDVLAVIQLIEIFTYPFNWIAQNLYYADHI